MPKNEQHPTQSGTGHASDSNQAEQGEFQAENGAPPQDQKSEAASAMGLDETVEQLRREREEYLSLWQRAQADYQNLRRRLAGDLDAQVRSRLQPLLESLLYVLDHLDMALLSPANSSEAKNLAMGVDMVRKQLVQTLENQEVQVIPDGGSFNPQLHEAVSKEERPGLAQDTVIATVRKGYTLSGKPLRPAQVRIATSESSATTTASSTQASTSQDS